MRKHEQWMRIYHRTWPYLERTALTLAHEENNPMRGGEDAVDLERALAIAEGAEGTEAELIECCARVMLRARARMREYPTRPGSAPLFERFQRQGEGAR